MPLITKEYNNHNPILWEISEDEDFFFEGLNLTSVEKNTLLTFSNPQRRKEFLCSRYILQKVLKINSEIIYDVKGKPFLKDKSFCISISHSKNIVGVFAHPNLNIGLDIEIIHPKIKKISSRFLNSKEVKFINESNEITTSVLIWCAKETLLKIHGCRKLDFKTTMNIQPFKADISGSLQCQLSVDGSNLDIRLKYFSYKDYYVVFGPINA